MKIKLLAFAAATEAVGGDALDLEVPDDETLDSLGARLRAAYPELAPLWDRLAVAVDGTLASRSDQPLMDGSEIALLPPVSGG